MASFTNQVQYRTGDTTSYTSQMDTWLDDGVKDVVDRACVVNPKNQLLFESTFLFGDSGYDISSCKILSVAKDLDNKIINAVHDGNISVTDRTVDVQIVSLRKKLGKKQSLIKTVRGVGYKLDE